MAAYGKTDGICEEPFIIGNDGEWYYLEEDDYEIVYDNVKDNSDSSFFFKVTEDGDKRTTEAENMRFSIDITVPEVKTLSFDLNAKIISSGKTVSTADFFDKENYEIRISINGEDYPVLYIHSDSKGRTFTYGEYYYNHVHDFSDWEMTYPLPTETTPGKEKHRCEECCFEEEREVAPKNSRDISIDDSALSKVYDGKPAAIDNESISFKGKGTVDPVIEFKPEGDDDSAYSINAPVNAGKYQVRVTVPAAGEYQAVSTYEAYYSIDRYAIDSNKINAEQLFSSENRVYNGMKQRWEIILSSTGSGEGYYNLPDMPAGEEIRLIAESDSADADIYKFYYNWAGFNSDGTVEIESIGDTALSNYNISLRGTAQIEKAKLEGSLTAEKEYDGNSTFIINNITGLSGIVDSDKDGLKFDISRKTADVTGDASVTYVSIYKNDENITKNYSFSNNQFSLIVKPRELKFAEFGDVLYTPYVKPNVAIDKKRSFELGPRNNLNGTWAILDTKNDSLDWNVEDEISFDNFYVNSYNHILDKANSPKTVKVVNVDKDITDFSSAFSIEPDAYVACKFTINEGEEIIIEGDGKDKVVPYVCNILGTHYYVDYPNANHSILVVNRASSSGSYSGYLFLYSKDGADNLTVKVQTKQK